VFKMKKKQNKEKSLEQELVDKDEKINDLVCTLQRLQAEFENYKKRIDREKEISIKYASDDIIIKLLPILDTFEIAIKNADEKSNFVDGMKLLFSQLYSTLEKEGLTQINPINEKFDPEKHEVLLCEESEKPENTVLEVLQKGYILKDRIIRHAKVKIAKNKTRCKDDNIKKDSCEGGP
jgi:molecular chaperone GrpE